MSNYLHELVGGYSNHKRRDVRKLFASMQIGPSPKVDTNVCDDNLQIAVGILIEFQQIGISKFSIQQAAQVVEIFGLASRFNGRDILVELGSLFSGPKIRLYSTVDDASVPDSGRIYDVPDSDRLQHMLKQFCGK